MRTVDPEHNWFWQQGYLDATAGRRAIAPDETRHSFQRSDYFAGYDAGQEDRLRERIALLQRIDAALAEGHSFQRSDYFAGYDAGQEDRATKQDAAVAERERQNG